MFIFFIFIVDYVFCKLIFHWIFSLCTNWRNIKSLFYLQVQFVLFSRKICNLENCCHCYLFIHSKTPRILQFYFISLQFLKLSETNYIFILFINVCTLQFIFLKIVLKILQYSVLRLEQIAFVLITIHEISSPLDRDQF